MFQPYLLFTRQALMTAQKTTCLSSQNIPGHLAAPWTLPPPAPLPPTPLRPWQRPRNEYRQKLLGLRRSFFTPQGRSRSKYEALHLNKETRLKTFHLYCFSLPLKQLDCIAFLLVMRRTFTTQRTMVEHN